jgi:hypothetical protein
MKTDWVKTADSSPDFYAVRAQLAPYPVGAGSQYLKVSLPATVSGTRSVGYLNNRIGTIVGQHEISAALKLGSGSIGTGIGLVLLWDNDRLDDVDALVLEWFGETGGTRLQLRYGPDLSGVVLHSVLTNQFNTWVHVLLQIRYDRVGNQQVWVATSTGSVLTPTWVKAFDQVLTGRHAAIRSGRSGFTVRAGQAGGSAAIDHIRVTSTLSTVT